MILQDVIDSDTAQIIQNGDFTKTITISDGVTSYDTGCIFDNIYQQVDPDTQALVTSTKPRALVWLKNLPFRPKIGHTVTRAGKTYSIRDTHPDGEGSLFLFLD